jgi:hypothetical protein
MRLLPIGFTQKKVPIIGIAGWLPRTPSGTGVILKSVT